MKTSSLPQIPDKGRRLFDPFTLPEFFPVALLVAALLLPLTGCGDRVLPVDNKTDAAKSYRIIFNQVVQGQNIGNLAIIGDKGEGRKEILSDYPITSTPAKGYAVIINEGQDFLNIVNVATGETVRQIPRRYGETINYFSAAISPRGDKIAYSVDYEDEPNINASTRRVVVADIDGNNPVLLNVGAAHESYIRFSPDGNRIAFFDATPERNGWLYVADVDGTNEYRIATIEEVAHDGHMFFEWSPDGTQLAYTDFDNGMMHFAAANGSGERSLLPGLWPDWSPDGTKLLFTDPATGKVSIINGNGSGSPEAVGPVGIQPQWSPDGKKIMYFEVDPNLELDQQVPILSVMDMATRQSTSITSDAFYGYWIE